MSLSNSLDVKPSFSYLIAFLNSTSEIVPLPYVSKDLNISSNLKAEV